MGSDKDEVRRRLREAADARDAIPEEERTSFIRPDRFIGHPIGVDDDGNFFEPLEDADEDGGAG